MPDSCGTFVGPPPGEVRTITFHGDAVKIETDAGTAYGGEFPLSGATGKGFDGRPGTVSLDAGWLAVSMTRLRSDDGTNVLREVYILSGKDILTVWRTLHVNLPNGTQGQIGCGNHAAIVYRKSSPASVQ
jgi:hypothetical protein